MPTFGYVRVSSIEQESGLGPEVQERAIRAYCADKGLHDLAITHESVSAETLIDRKALLGLLADARELSEAGQEVHIVFRSSDRLARDVIDQESVVADSFRYGFRLHSTLPHEFELFDPTKGRDPMRTAIRQFFGVFNQLERAIIQRRLDGGLQLKAGKGQSTGGRYPFGYMAVNGEMVPCPEEVPAVKRAFWLEAQGLNLPSIAAVLAREFPGPCGHWNKVSVKRLLDRRELYVHGQYRSRLAATPTHRPDLVLAPPEAGESAHAPTPAGRPIDWSSVPDPVGVHALAVMLGRERDWIMREIEGRALRVRWHKRTPMLPRATAQALAALASATVEGSGQKSGT